MEGGGAYQHHDGEEPQQRDQFGGEPDEDLHRWMIAGEHVARQFPRLAAGRGLG